jgi:cytochrome c oxidase assembly protein subunit 15
LELCLLVTIAAILSPIWRRLTVPDELLSVARFGWITAALVYLQLIAGAAMRHLGAGLAIPTFPRATHEGAWVPKIHNAFVDLNFFHTRVGALLVTACVVTLVVRAWRDAAGEVHLIRPAAFLLVLTVAQLAMGVFVIWRMRPPILTTLHVVNGAAVLATTVLLAARASRGARGRNAALPSIATGCIQEARV